MRVIGVAGWSGAGKTTLLTRLIPLLIKRGMRISTLKHAHRGFDIDRPGKDSYEHRAAGASEVLVSSARHYALLHNLGPGEKEPALPELLRLLAPVDLVLVEGFKEFAHPKIEVHRSANGKPLLYGNAPNIRAIATDAAELAVEIPVVDLNDAQGIAELALANAEPIETVLADLEARPRPQRIAPRPQGKGARAAS